MDKIVWFYDEYCSKHPRATELVLVCAAILAVHIGLAYVKDAAQKIRLAAPTAVVQNPTKQTFSPTISNHDQSTNSEYLLCLQVTQI
jgi:hypothetical protein